MKTEDIKKMYPIGTRIKLGHMDNQQAVPSGTLGTVDHVDDGGTIHMKWDTGSSLGLIVGEDSFSIVHEQELEQEEVSDTPKMITILIVEPDMKPYEAIVEDEYEIYNSLVGGYIEELRLSDTASIICNENGKLMSLPANRRISNDVIVGRFFITGVNDDEGTFESLPKEDIELYKERFKEIEHISELEVSKATKMTFISGF